jgi:hypothetical protein
MRITFELIDITRSKSAGRHTYWPPIDRQNLVRVGIGVYRKGIENLELPRNRTFFKDQFGSFCTRLYIMVRTAHLKNIIVIQLAVLAQSCVKVSKNRDSSSVWPAA